MTQFDTFPNPLTQWRREFPLVVCLQSPSMSGNSTQIIAPLTPRRLIDASRLTPLIVLDDHEYVALVPRLTSVPAQVLKSRVANLSRHRDALLAAVDLVFYGV